MFRLPALENRTWFSGGAAASRKFDLQSPREVRGEVIYVDSFGNLVSNIDRPIAERFGTRFRHKSLSVRIKRGAAMRILDAYGDAPKGAPLAIFGSFGLLEVAIRDGNAAMHFAAGTGTSVSLTRI